MALFLSSGVLDCAGQSPPVHTARRCRPGRLAVLVTLVVAMLGLMPALATADNPLEIVSKQSIDSRLQEWTLETPALAAQTKVRILLPTGSRYLGLIPT